MYGDNERPAALRGQASSNQPQSGTGMLEENFVAFILVHIPFTGEAIPTKIQVIGISILQLRAEAEHWEDKCVHLWAVTDVAHSVLLKPIPFLSNNLQ